MFRSDIAREMVLRFVPASERMKTYAQIRTETMHETVKTIIEGTVGLLIFAILNWYLGGDVFIYGYLTGIAVIFYALELMFYRYSGQLFIAPTQEEFDKLGDDLA